MWNFQATVQLPLSHYHSTIPILMVRELRFMQQKCSNPASQKSQESCKNLYINDLQDSIQSNSIDQVT